MSNSSDIILKRAEVLIDQERYELAAKELYKILTTEPEHVDAIANLVRSLTGSSQYSEAKKWIEKLLYLAPDRAYFYYLAAFVEVRIKDFDLAEKHIRTAIQLEPDWAMHFEVLSRIYQHRGKYEEGLIYANEGLRLDPDHIDCLDARLFSLSMLGHKEEAWATINQALKLEPENPYLRRDIGVALMHLGDYEAAEYHLQETLRIEPSYEDVQKHLGKIIKQKQWPYRISRTANVVFNRLLSLPSRLPHTEYGYVLLSLLFIAVLFVFLFFKQQTMVWALLILPLGCLLFFISLYLFQFLFNTLWKPVIYISDLWLYTHKKHKHLYQTEKQKVVQTGQLIGIGVILLVLCIIFGKNVPLLAWIVLTIVVLYWYSKHSQKNTSS
ncbi:tetratricopeptide repeat protein [Xanthocytophaga flava]|uniref:tetratricopeptide repeat protein n=1 Tax=Xanthocytophaga flava TaxID=3048013 RepID=UPI0028D09825|nr:tetratricopeptide repeat protein [Xanthocytophaga flavus]MDJ1471559.1 tetratricopeptide repeat protein [Xanthocytophaga flavus]